MDYDNTTLISLLLDADEKMGGATYLQDAADAITQLQARLADAEALAIRRGEIQVQLQARVAELERLLTYTGLLVAQEEHNALSHDIARHVQITADQAQELEQLRADLAAARALLTAERDNYRYSLTECEKANTALSVQLATAKADRNTYDSAHKSEAAAHLRTMNDLAATRALLAAALDAIENHATQRTFAGGVVLSNTTIKIRAALAGKDAT